MEDKKWLDGAQQKLEWIKKRVQLNDQQEEYLGFMLNEQEKFICGLSGHIYAMKANSHLSDFKELQFFLDAAMKDIQERDGQVKNENEELVTFDELNRGLSIRVVFNDDENGYRETSETGTVDIINYDKKTFILRHDTRPASVRCMNEWKKIYKQNV